MHRWGSFQPIPTRRQSAGLARRGPAAAAFVLALALGAGARADPQFGFSGYGTLGETHSSESQADFNSSIFKPGGAGHTRDWSAEVDTRVAGQLDARFGGGWSAVVQALVEQQYDNSYKPTIEWANLKYEATPDLSIRLGRSVMPSFLYSDTRKIGYSFEWVRPPMEVYSLVPISKNDGIDANYRFHLGELTETVQANYGALDTKEVDGSTTHAHNQWGVYDMLEIGSLTAHATYHQTHLDLTALHSFFEAFRAFGPPGSAIADRYECAGKIASTLGLGASVDPGRWFVAGEWARTDRRCFVGAQSAAYLSAGYRVQELTPYVTLAQLRVQSATRDPGISLAGLPPPLAGFAAGLNGALNGILASTGAQRSLSLGARWDFRRDVDLKFQADRVHLAAGSNGVLQDAQPGFAGGSAFWLTSMTLDFVF
jgi:hypothetical protein